MMTCVSALWVNLWSDRHAHYGRATGAKPT